MSGRRVLVVGAGVVGLCIAHFLRQQGVEVEVVDRSEAGHGASLANGGWFSPVQSAPLPSPGLTIFGLRSLVDRDSALYFKPGLLPELLPWLLRFWRATDRRAFERGTSAIAALGSNTFSLLDDMSRDGVQFESHRLGVLYAGFSRNAIEKELKNLEPMRAFGYGIPDSPLDSRAIAEIEPSLEGIVASEFLITEHRHVRPDSFTGGLARQLIANGVAIREGVDVLDFQVSGGRVRAARTSAGDLVADDYVLAAGSWTGVLARQAGVRLPVQAGKGYSFDIRTPTWPRHAILLADAHIGCTPYGDFVRIGGTMEFSGLNTQVDRRRVANMIRATHRLFPGWDGSMVDEPWAGLRPILPDGLPVLDRSTSVDNLYVATGHAMQGMTLGPSSGYALASFIVDGERPAVLEPFQLSRFG